MIRNASNIFEVVARDWHSKQSERRVLKTEAKIIRYLVNDVFSYIGSRPIADIDPPELLDMLRKIEARGLIIVIPNNFVIQAIAPRYALNIVVIF